MTTAPLAAPVLPPMEASTEAIQPYSHPVGRAPAVDYVLIPRADFDTTQLFLVIDPADPGANLQVRSEDIPKDARKFNDLYQFVNKAACVNPEGDPCVLGLRSDDLSFLSFITPVHRKGFLFLVFIILIPFVFWLGRYLWDNFSKVRSFLRSSVSTCSSGFGRCVAHCSCLGVCVNCFGWLASCFERVVDSCDRCLFRIDEPEPPPVPMPVEVEDPFPAPLVLPPKTDVPGFDFDVTYPPVVDPDSSSSDDVAVQIDEDPPEEIEGLEVQQPPGGLLRIFDDPNSNVNGVKAMEIGAGSGAARRGSGYGSRVGRFEVTRVEEEVTLDSEHDAELTDADNGDEDAGADSPLEESHSNP